MEIDPVQFVELRTDVTSALTGVASLNEALVSVQDDVRGVHEDVRETLRNAKLTNGRVTELEKQLAIDRAVGDALTKAAKEQRVERRQDVRAFVPGFMNTLLGAAIATTAAIVLHFA